MHGGERKGFRLNCSKLCGGRHPEGFQLRRVLDAIIITRGHVSGFLEEKSTPRFSTCVSRRARARARTCPSRERFNSIVGRSCRLPFWISALAPSRFSRFFPRYFYSIDARRGKIRSFRIFGIKFIDLAKRCNL